jgi:hypothetical protein
METSLIVVVGFIEFSAAGNTAFKTGEWKCAYVEVYVIIAAFYFAFVFGLSRYGASPEARMNVGYRKGRPHGPHRPPPSRPRSCTSSTASAAPCTASA